MAELAGYVIPLVTRYSTVPADQSPQDVRQLLEELPKAIERARSDTSFRAYFATGPSLGQTSENRGAWTALASALTKATTAPIEQEVSLYLLRLCRNLLAHAPENQACACAAGIHECAENLIKMYEMHTDPEALMLVKTAAQVIANELTANDAVQDVLWERFFVKRHMVDFKRLLNYKEDVGFVTLMILLNLIQARPQRRRDLMTSEGGKEVIRQILDSMEDLSSSESSRQFELSFKILGSLIDDGLFVSLLNDARDNGHKSTKDISSSLHALLKVFDAKIYQSQSQNDGRETEPNLETCQALIPLFKTISSQVIKLMHQLYPASTNVIISADAVSTSPSTSSISIDDTSILYSTLILLLQIFGYRHFASSDKETEAIRQCWMDQGLIQALLGLLKEADQTLPRLTKSMSSQGLQEGDVGQGLAGFANVKRDVVKIIGNVANGSKQVQDMASVREEGGLLLILNQCNIDDRNPYIREYAILAIRNLVINNPQNQAFIRDLQPIETQQHPVLQELGIRTDLTPDGHGVKLSRAP